MKKTYLSLETASLALGTETSSATGSKQPYVAPSATQVPLQVSALMATSDYIDRGDTTWPDTGDPDTETPDQSGYVWGE